MKVVFAIRSLDIGGAERQFIELVKHIDKTRFDVTVCTMYGGVMEDEVKKILGIHYINLQKKGRYDIGFYFHYKKLLHQIKPDIIYSFLGEMNLFSLWCKPRKTKLVWAFAASFIDFKKYGRLSQLLFWLQKIYSQKVDLIIANSHAAITYHKNENFYMDNAIVIPNGIDIKRFQRDRNKRQQFRQKFNLSHHDIAIGIVARLDYMKGYPILAQSAQVILEKYEKIYFFSAGRGDEKIKNQCESILGKYNNKRFIWLDSIQNIEEVYNGLDILVSSSLGEGLSNSILEAMSCEVPCVVTDVGDSKIAVGDTGIVVQPGSVEELVNGIEKILQMDLKELGINSRKRIEENYSMENMVKKTEQALIACME